MEGAFMLLQRERKVHGVHSKLNSRSFLPLQKAFRPTKNRQMEFPLNKNHKKRTLDVCHYGQVFTPEEIMHKMLSLRQNRGTVLEPSCGNGAFLKHLKSAVGIELDPNLIGDRSKLGSACVESIDRHYLAEKAQDFKIRGGQKILVGDFFSYPLENKFKTIIGNPPYVRFQDILPETKKLLPMEWFDRRSNLYLFFIAKSMAHLQEGGELIFITPRDFLKATSAKRLNYELYSQGTITYYCELGDLPVFKGYAPNCAIWRWQKGCFNRELSSGHAWFNHNQGQLWFGKPNPSGGCVADLFDVKVGAVSGADSIFKNEEHGNVDMVCSHTAVTGKTRRMIYNQKVRVLDRHKEQLMNRRIRVFDESNWWEWGRKHCEREGPRIYVNSKTRNPKPFFTHKSTFYDGAVLALFPKSLGIDIQQAVDHLNQMQWPELGFACGGRLLFSQQSLSNAPLELNL